MQSQPKGTVEVLPVRIRVVQDIWGVILKKSDVTHYLRISSCGKNFYIAKCKNCGSYFRVPRRCSDRNWCPACNWVYAKKQAEKWYFFFAMFLMKWRHVYLLHFVFTLPKKYHRLLAPDEEKKLREAVRYALEDPYGRKNAGIMSLHYWHSREPWNGEYYPHVHVIVPSIVFKPIKEKRRIVGYNPIRTGCKIDVERVKRRYKEKLRELGFDVPDNCDVDVYVSYTNLRNKKKCLHILRYLYYRPVWYIAKQITDLVLHVSQVVDFNYAIDNVLSKDEIKFMFELITNMEKRKRVFVFGWLTSKPMKMFRQWIERFLGTKDWSKPKLCPICGGELEIVGIEDKPPPEPPDFGPLKRYDRTERWMWR